MAFGDEPLKFHGNFSESYNSEMREMQGNQSALLGTGSEAGGSLFPETGGGTSVFPQGAYEEDMGPAQLKAYQLDQAARPYDTAINQINRSGAEIERAFNQGQWQTVGQLLAQYGLVSSQNERDDLTSMLASRDKNAQRRGWNYINNKLEEFRQKELRGRTTATTGISTLPERAYERASSVMEKAKYADVPESLTTPIRKLRENLYQYYGIARQAEARQDWGTARVVRVKAGHTQAQISARDKQVAEYTRQQDNLTQLEKRATNIQDPVHAAQLWATHAMWGDKQRGAYYHPKGRIDADLFDEWFNSTLALNKQQAENAYAAAEKGLTEATAIITKGGAGPQVLVERTDPTTGARRFEQISGTPQDRTARAEANKKFYTDRLIKAQAAMELAEANTIKSGVAILRDRGQLGAAQNLEKYGNIRGEQPAAPKEKPIPKPAEGGTPGILGAMQRFMKDVVAAEAAITPEKTAPGAPVQRRAPWQDIEKEQWQITGKLPMFRATDRTPLDVSPGGTFTVEKLGQGPLHAKYAYGVYEHATGVARGVVKVEDLLAMGMRPEARMGTEPEVVRAKGPGYLGTLKRPDGMVSSELSIGVNIDGEEVEIPSLVPTLNKPEIDFLLGGGKPTKEIVDKAVEQAKKRIAEGKSPFAQEGEQTRGPISELPLRSDYSALGRDAEAPVTPGGWKLVEPRPLEPEQIQRRRKGLLTTIQEYAPIISAGGKTVWKQPKGGYGPNIAGVSLPEFVPATPKGKQVANQKVLKAQEELFWLDNSGMAGLRDKIPEGWGEIFSLSTSLGGLLDNPDIYHPGAVRYALGRVSSFRNAVDELAAKGKLSPELLALIDRWVPNKNQIKNYQYITKGIPPVGRGTKERGELQREDLTGPAYMDLLTLRAWHGLAGTGLLRPVSKLLAPGPLRDVESFMGSPGGFAEQAAQWTGTALQWAFLGKAARPWVDKALGAGVRGARGGIATWLNFKDTYPHLANGVTDALTYGLLSGSGALSEQLAEGKVDFGQVIEQGTQGAVLGFAFGYTMSRLKAAWQQAKYYENVRTTIRKTHLRMMGYPEDTLNNKEWWEWFNNMGQFEKAMGRHATPGEMTRGIMDVAPRRANPKSPFYKEFYRARYKGFADWVSGTEGPAKGATGQPTGAQPGTMTATPAVAPTGGVRPPMEPPPPPGTSPIVPPPGPPVSPAAELPPSAVLPPVEAATPPAPPEVPAEAKPAEAPAAKEPGQMTFAEFRRGAFDEPEVYTRIARNESPLAAKLVKALHAKGIATLDTHQDSQEIVVRIDQVHDTLTSNIQDALTSVAGVSFTTHPEMGFGKSAQGTSYLHIPVEKAEMLIERLSVAGYQALPKLGEGLDTELLRESRGEWDAQVAAIHELHVQEALAGGKAVPEENLKLYGLTAEVPSPAAKVLTTEGKVERPGEVRPGEEPLVGKKTVFGRAGTRELDLGIGAEQAIKDGMEPEKTGLEPLSKTKLEREAQAGARPKQESMFTASGKVKKPESEKSVKELVAQKARELESEYKGTALPALFPYLAPHSGGWQRRHLTATKAGKPTGRKTTEWEEFKEQIPLAHRRTRENGGKPIDEALDEAKRLGLFREDASESDFLEAYRTQLNPDFRDEAEQLLGLGKHEQPEGAGEAAETGISVEAEQEALAFFDLLSEEPDGVLTVPRVGRGPAAILRQGDKWKVTSASGNPAEGQTFDDLEQAWLSAGGTVAGEPMVSTEAGAELARTHPGLWAAGAQNDPDPAVRATGIPRGTSGRDLDVWIRDEPSPGLTVQLPPLTRQQFRGLPPGAVEIEKEMPDISNIPVWKQIKAALAPVATVAGRNPDARWLAHTARYQTRYALADNAKYQQQLTDIEAILSRAFPEGHVARHPEMARWPAKQVMLKNFDQILRYRDALYDAWRDGRLDEVMASGTVVLPDYLREANDAYTKIAEAMKAEAAAMGKDVSKWPPTHVYSPHYWKGGYQIYETFTAPDGTPGRKTTGIKQSVDDALDLAEEYLRNNPNATLFIGKRHPQFLGSAVAVGRGNFFRIKTAIQQATGMDDDAAYDALHGALRMEPQGKYVGHWMPRKAQLGGYDRTPSAWRSYISKVTRKKWLDPLIKYYNNMKGRLPVGLRQYFDKAIPRITSGFDPMDPMFGGARWVSRLTRAESKLKLGLRFGTSWSNRLQRWHMGVPEFGVIPMLKAHRYKYTEVGRALLDELGIAGERPRYSTGEFLVPAVEKLGRLLAGFSRGEMQNREDILTVAFLDAQSVYRMPRAEAEAKGYGYKLEYLDHFPDVPDEALALAKRIKLIDQNATALPPGMKGLLASKHFALDANRDINGDYNASDLPALFQTPIGRLAFQFKYYPANFIAVNAKWIADAARDPNPHNVARVLRLMAAHVLLGGLRSIPYLGRLLWKAALLGVSVSPPVRRIIGRGLFSVLGIDMSRRVGPNEFARLSGPAGPAGSDAKAIWDATMGKITWDDAMARIAPAYGSLRQTLRDTQNVRDPYDRQRLLYRATTIEKVLEAMGLPQLRRELWRDALSDILKKVEKGRTGERLAITKAIGELNRDGFISEETYQALKNELGEDAIESLLQENATREIDAFSRKWKALPKKYRDEFGQNILEIQEKLGVDYGVRRAPATK